MPDNEVIKETANTAAQEVAKNSDKMGAIMAGIGFAGGVGLVVGFHIVKNKVAEKRSKKAAEKAKSAEKTEEK